MKLELVAMIAGWIGSFLVVGSYFWSAKKENIKIFHIANVVGSCILVPAQLYLNVPFAAFISFSFGLIAAYGLFKTRSLD